MHRLLLIPFVALALVLTSCVQMDANGSSHFYSVRNYTGQGVAVYGAANNCTDAPNVEMFLRVTAKVEDGGDGTTTYFPPVMLCENGVPTNLNFLGWATANGTTVEIVARAWGSGSGYTVIGGVMEGTGGARQFVM